MKILPLTLLVLVGSIVIESSSGWLPSSSSLSPFSSNSNNKTSRKMVTIEEQKLDSSLISSIHDSVREVLQIDDIVQQELNNKYNLVLRRIDDWKDVSIKSCVGNRNNQKLALPLHFGLTLNGATKTTENDTSSSQAQHGLVTFYMAYSTWEGRMLYVDHLSVDAINIDHKEQIELLILQALARIAVKLNCSRLMWRTNEELPSSSALLNSPYDKPETLGEILTLYMDKDAMEQYVVKDNQIENSVDVPEGSWGHDLVSKSILNCLKDINESSSSSKSQFRFRLARKEDLNTVTKLVQGLADYVNEPDEVYLTADDYLRDGFSETDEPLFYFLLMDRRVENDNWIPCGYAAFYFGYEIGSEGGRFIYLEDLFLEVEHRKLGGGSLMMKTLSNIALSLQCSRFYWQALDWNAAGLNFYNKIGATIQEGVTTRRYCGESLKTFAAISHQEESQN